MMTEMQAVATSKMKVHPAMLMKTNRGRFQVSGARCQAGAPEVDGRALMANTGKLQK
jgi:hypothetical protein